MRKIAFMIALLSLMSSLMAKEKSYNLTSPDGRLKTNIVANNNSIIYDVTFDNHTILVASPIMLNYIQL